jgi:hypothetical protein
MTDHKVVGREDWEAAREELLQREKEHTRMADELARQRRELRVRCRSIHSDVSARVSGRSASRWLRPSITRDTTPAPRASSGAARSSAWRRYKGEEERGERNGGDG